MDEADTVEMEDVERKKSLLRSMSQRSDPARAEQL